MTEQAQSREARPKGRWRGDGRTVCVFCSSSLTIDEKYVRLAAEVGTELARRGHTLVSGGGSISCMGAIARAARAGGARTIGVIPQALVDLEVGDHDADELIVTPDMNVRKTEMERRADAFMVLPGGLGTMEELFEVWSGRNLGLHDKPIAILDPTGLYAPLRDLGARLYEERFVRAKAFDAITWVTTVAEAFDVAEGTARPLEGAPDEVLESEP